MIEASEKHLLRCVEINTYGPQSLDSDQFRGDLCPERLYDQSRLRPRLWSRLIDCHMYCNLDPKIKISHDGHFKTVGEDQDLSFLRDHQNHHLSQYFGFLMSSQFLV